jgi:hypothetical protein
VTTAATGAIRTPAVPGAAMRIMAPLAALHGAMFLYDLRHPERFLNGDRALERIEVIQGLAQTNDLTGYLTSHGIAGDWLPQALLYLAGGQYLVIAVQVVLTLFSILWVMQIAQRLGLGERAAGAAAVLYALLPHTLVFPHELATEGIFCPLVILAFRLGANASGGLALGLATLIRPLTALWPFVVWRRSFIVLALAPLLAWMSFMYIATGEFSMGRSGHDLGNNLYFRMQRMSSELPKAERPPERGPGQTKATIGEYAAFVAAHPVLAAKHSARDVGVLTVKSGIERIVLDYLDLYPESRKELQSSDSGWRAQVEQRGVVAALWEVFRQQPGLIVCSALGAALFVVFMALAACGALSRIRSREWLLLAAFVVYIFATAQAVDAAHSRHRAPAEFALCILAVAGWLALRRRGEKHVR